MSDARVPETPVPATARADLGRLRISEAERRRARRRRPRWPWVLGGAILVVALLVLLTRPATVQVSTARAGGGAPTEEGGALLTANGYVEARHAASVAARTTGRLAEVLVEEGDSVSGGEVVARLIDDDQRVLLMQAEANIGLARARLEQAKANAAEAARRAERRATLRSQNVESAENAEAAETAAATAQAEVAAAEAALRVAEANRAAARLELDKTKITAPFAGVVLRKDAEIGEIVGPIMTSNTARAGAVVTIADLGTLEVGVDVNESYIARLAVGGPADIVLDAHPELHFPATIRTIYPSADRDRATIPVRVAFAQADPRIRPDLGAKVSFLERPVAGGIRVIPKTLRVPRVALRERDGETIVWVLREGRLRANVVTLGDSAGDEVVVLSGLTEGDQVLTSGLRAPRDGQRVRVAQD
ncbi:MAG: efflux RND transporter periplasmic adaptor subunit [Planctomycetes bacterium]|nr:efflux RND transporter periplasmic adaptor subunit [Planctomycetota bacterium]